MKKLLFSIGLLLGGVLTGAGVVYAVESIRITTDNATFSGHLVGTDNVEEALEVIDGLELGGDPGGSDTHIQFNDGSSFGGESAMTYNKTLDRLDLRGTMSGYQIHASNGLTSSGYGIVTDPIGHGSLRNSINLNYDRGAIVDGVLEVFFNNNGSGPIKKQAGILISASGSDANSQLLDINFDTWGSATATNLSLDSTLRGVGSMAWTGMSVNGDADARNANGGAVTLTGYSAIMRGPTGNGLVFGSLVFPRVVGYSSYLESLDSASGAYAYHADIDGSPDNSYGLYVTDDATPTVKEYAVFAEDGIIETKGAFSGGSLNIKGTSRFQGTASGLTLKASNLLTSSGTYAFRFGSVELVKPNGKRHSYSISADTDAARGTALINAVNDHGQYDTIVVTGSETYDVDATNLPLLTGATLTAVGFPTLRGDSLTEPLVEVRHSYTTVSNFRIETNTAGVGAWDEENVTATGVTLRNLEVQGIDSDSSGVMWAESGGGGTGAHKIGARIFDSKFHGGTTLGYGLYAHLSSDSLLQLYNLDVFGATDGVLFNNDGDVEIYGGYYTSTLDAITAGNSTTIKVIGARARGDQADLYGDDGTIEASWVDARTSFIVGNGISFDENHPVVGSLEIYSGQIDFTSFGSTPDSGFDRVSAATLKVTDGTTGRGDLEVADLAYNATTWNGSFEVPTRNAMRDILEDIIDGYTFTGDVTVKGTVSGSTILGHTYQIGPIVLYGPNSKVATGSGADIFCSQSGTVIRTIWDTDTSGDAVAVGIDNPSGVSIYSSNPSVTTSSVTDSATITNGKCGPYKALTPGLGTIGANAASGMTLTLLIRATNSN